MPKDTPTGKQLKNGLWVETTYEIRYIDAHGDAQEVETYETLKEAKAEFAKRYDRDGAYVAWVLERHKAYYPMHLSPGDSYVVLDYAGDDDALDAWGLE